MSDWKEDTLRHKYDPLPEDAPRHRKKLKKKRVRSDHKHEYETVCIDAHSVIYRRGEKIPYLYLGKRCRICGRLNDWRHTNLSEPPDGMQLYEVPNWGYLWGKKKIPEEMRVK